MDTLEISLSPAHSKDTQILSLKGPLTLATLFEFQNLIRQPDMKGLIVDFSAVPYMDSAGLGALLGQYAHAQRGGYVFALAGVPARILTILQMTHTDTILPQFASVQEADNKLAGVATA